MKPATEPAIDARRMPFALAALILALLASALLVTPAAAQGASRAAGEQVSDGPRIWWNMARYIEELALSAEQRKAMDKILEAYRTERREAGQLYAEDNRAFTEALTRGDFQAAEAANVRLSARSTDLARMANDLKMAVFRQLKPEQRTRLAEYPALLRRPWMMGGRSGARNQRPGAGG